MKTRTPDQVLDEIARDQLGQDINLSSGILAKMRKVDQKNMKKKFVLSGSVAVVLVLVILLSIPSVAMAVKRLFGYVPGTGLVEQNVPVRVLKEPVEIKTGDTTILVSQAVTDSNLTRLTYQIDNIPDSTSSNLKWEDVCHALPNLVLSDGTVLQPQTINGNSWASGLSRLLEYDALPAEENSIKMTFACIEAGPVTDALSNIELQLEFIPAPEDMTVFEVVELPTPTLDASQTELPANAASPISLVLNKYVQTDENLILLGALQTDATDFRLSLLESDAIHLIDKVGNEIPLEEDYSLTDPEATTSAAQSLPLTYRTAGRYLPGEASLIIDYVWVQQSTNASFTFDAGSNPQPGQTWTVNQPLNANGRTFQIKEVVLDQTGTGLSIYYEAPEGTANLMLVDLEHELLGGGGGDDNTGFTYRDAFPGGRITVTLTGYDERLSGPWQTSITLPEFADGLVPTPIPDACLTSATWQTAINAGTLEIPQGLADTLIMAYPMAPDYYYHILSARLDGSDPIDLGQGSGGSLSPDGKTLVYSTNDGLALRDMQTGETSLIPDTFKRDSGPLWSPDGTKIAFTRGPASGSAGAAGPYSLMWMSSDGSNEPQGLIVTEANYTQAWMPDSNHLVYTVKTAEGSLVNQINVENGQVINLTSINYQNASVAVSPDGKRIAYEAMMPGEHYAVYVSDLDGSNARLIANADPLVVTNPFWSPDGKWLAVTVHDIVTENALPNVALVNPETCQVIPVTSLHGYINSWQ